MAAPADSSASSARPTAARDVRFCPYCGQMSFDIMGLREGSVYCEFCGVDIPVAELVKTL